MKTNLSICLAALIATTAAAPPASESGKLQTDRWFEQDSYERDKGLDLDFTYPSYGYDYADTYDYDYDALDPDEDLFDFDWLETTYDRRLEYPLVSPAPPDGKTSREESPRQQNQKKHWSDSRLTRLVERKLQASESVPAHSIDVAVNNGVVTLTGEVSSYAAKRQATHAAAAIRGVNEVENGLTVTTPAVEDRVLAGRVRAAILESGAADLNDLRVTARNGRVALEGTVQSFQERLMADEAAAKVRGARSLRNLLAIEIPQTRPDAEIEADIQSRLKWDSLVNHENIEVEVSNGVARLYGATDSAWEKRRAVLDSWVAGVKKVDAQQLVARPVTQDQWQQVTAKQKDKKPSQASGAAAQSQRGSQNQKSNQQEGNQELQQAVKQSVSNRTGLRDDHVNIAVNQGLVTLTGAVDTLFERSEAYRAAASVAGVNRVYNLLKVRPDNRPSDPSVARKVQEAIDRDAFLEQSEIHVLARNGKVWLSGAVDNRFERTHAHNVVAGIKGVLAIQNNLRVEGANEPLGGRSVARFYGWGAYADSDAEIEEAIENEMFWSPFVDADEVGVSVIQGEATLVGIVDSLAEKVSAEENAYEAGARRVDNRLVIGDPGLL